MNLFESNFLRRTRYLTEDKRAFLLDTMGHMNQECRRLGSAYDTKTDHTRKDDIIRSFNTELEKGVMTAYLLLDSPVERTAMQVEKRLHELEQIKKNTNVQSLYGASHCKYVRKESELGPELEDAFNLAEYELMFSDEAIPDSKKEEYHEQMVNYMTASEADRERFIKEVTHPYSTHKPHRLVKMGRGERD